jgi:glucokinase
LIVYGPNVHWHGYDLVGLLERHVKEPVKVENDVTLAAIGQAWRGEGQSVSGFVTLSIGTGIGAAIFANGQILRGRHNMAGEIGALVTSREQLRGEPGAICGFESVASGPAIARRAKELIEAGSSSSLSAETVDAQAIFAAALQKDGVARAVLEELLDHVSMAIIDIAAVLDPERVILDGSVGRALKPYADDLLGRVSARIPNPPTLRFSGLGPNATVIGAIAAALALDRDLDAERAVDEIPSSGVRAIARLPTYGEQLPRGDGRSG